MTKVYDIASLGGIVQVRFVRSPQVEDFCRALDEVVELDANQFRLWDFSCGVNWSTQQLEKIAAYAKITLRTPASKIAIIAPDDLTYGLFRIHDVFRADEYSEQIVFRTETEALNWLYQQMAGPIHVA